ncbi:hypothetical protein GCM10025771_13790 [Niveibacterium umoris]|uniref:Ca2+/Na+ antiporter n=1 Tax=Niveibacterium umoris TaxID=1193620 RepID=A0A840BUB4_9RHOO|nr:hypothetical protein [Niveibacterium umoris]MBB4014979.1 Ca2+/Na+ antiporter [Niveibacterium umoris]
MRRNQIIGVSAAYSVAAIAAMTFRREVFDYETLSRQVTFWHALAASVPYVLIDLALLIACLRTWNYSNSWRRALVALLVFVIYLVFSAVTMLHAPSWHIFHVLILLAVCVFLAGLFLSSLLESQRERESA